MQTKHSVFFGWGSVSRATIQLSWVLCTFAFMGPFLHINIVKIIFFDSFTKTNIIQAGCIYFFFWFEKILKLKHFMAPKNTIGLRHCLLCLLGKLALRIGKVYYLSCQTSWLQDHALCILCCPLLMPLESLIYSNGSIISIE